MNIQPSELEKASVDLMLRDLEYIELDKYLQPKEKNQSGSHR